MLNVYLPRWNGTVHPKQQHCIEKMSRISRRYWHQSMSARLLPDLCLEESCVNEAGLGNEHLQRLFDECKIVPMGRELFSRNIHLDRLDKVARAYGLQFTSPERDTPEGMVAFAIAKFEAAMDRAQKQVASGVYCMLPTTSSKPEWEILAIDWHQMKNSTTGTHGTRALELVRKFANNTDLMVDVKVTFKNRFAARLGVITVEGSAKGEPKCLVDVRATLLDMVLMAGATPAKPTVRVPLAVAVVMLTRGTTETVWSNGKKVSFVDAKFAPVGSEALTIWEQIEATSRCHDWTVDEVDTMVDLVQAIIG